MTQIPIPFPENTEIYLTAISIVIALIFEKQIQEFIEHKNGRISKLVASIVAIFFVFLVILLVYALINILIIWTSPLNFILKVGNNYGTVFYVTGILILARPLLNNRTNESLNNIWTTKELILPVILFLLGGIYNNF